MSIFYYGAVRDIVDTLDILLDMMMFTRNNMYGNFDKWKWKM